MSYPLPAFSGLCLAFEDNGILISNLRSETTSGLLTKVSKYVTCLLVKLFTHFMRRRCNIGFGNQNLPTTMLSQGYMGGMYPLNCNKLVGQMNSFSSPLQTSHIGSAASASLSFGHTWYDVGLGIIYTSEFQERQGTSSQAAVTCICNIEHWLCRRLEC